MVRSAVGIGLVGVFALAGPPVGAASEGGRGILNLNPGWKFIQADPAGAAAPDFDDHAWSTVSTPHTYNDVDTFDDWSLPGHRGEQDQWGGRTWYRKTFILSASDQGKKVYVEFEAARQVAEVYLNGHLLGVSRTGFTPFGFDLTPHLRFGAPNVLAVMCDNRFMKDPMPAAAALPAPGPTPTPSATPTPSPSPSPGSTPGRPDLNLAPPASSALAEQIHKMSADIPEEVDKLQADQIPWNNPHWHPAHGGLYRNVRLHVTDPLHISLPLYSFLETAGPYAYATEISARSARVGLEVPIENGRASREEVELVAQVLDRSGASVLTLTHREPMASGARAVFKVSGRLRDPQLWEPDHPYLYRVVCRVRVRGSGVDDTEVPLGIRSVRWEAKAGFFINGHHLKLHGWGQKPTDEWPGLGAAQPDWLHFFTLKLMKDAGANFVRWGHCGGGPASIAAGDRLGIIADQPGCDGEADTHGAAWKVRLAAFRDTVVYYRNNPSVLIWEGGNQKVSREHAQELRASMDTFDAHGGRAYAHRRADQVTAEFMHVGIGTEGGREIKELPVVEGEYDREEAPRRVWDDASPPNFGYPEAKGQTYQLTSEQFAVNEVAHYVKKLGTEDHAGGANWIFSDSTSGGRVAVEVARASGEVDGVRLPKEAYFVCRAMFRADAQVHIVGHWTYPAGTKKAVYVASNAEEVELLVNGRSLGRATPADRYLFAFKDVAWEPGEIEARGFVGGKAVAVQTKPTVGPAVALRLMPITGPGGLQADGSDVLLVDVEAVDAQGRRHPTFQRRVDFEIAGPGIWRGGYDSGKVGSINHTDLDLEAGINRVAVRATLAAGTITIRATSHGLAAASVTVASRPVPMADGFTTSLPRLPEAVPAERAAVATAAVPPGLARPAASSTSGRFVRSFSYSGPTAGVGVQRDAQDGKRVFADRDLRFAGLPPSLRGADYVQASAADGLYSAVDLMELAVAAGTVVSIAHDDRLSRPEWLTRQFQPTPAKLAIGGQAMTVFARRAEGDESLTLGANTETREVAAAQMYVVFVSPAR